MNISYKGVKIIGSMTEKLSKNLATSE